MFTFLLSLPASVKVGGAFFLILLLNRFGLPLAWSILVNAVLLGLWSGGGLSSFRYEASVLLGPESLLLILDILLLLFLTESLNASGRMERTINSLKAGLRRPRLLYAGLPALIGLLPMPGGAIFSAPLVDALDHEKRFDPALKSAINYWFRHIWEYWWPLYPGVILAMKYSGLPVAVFFCIQAPLTLFAVMGGVLFILNRIHTHGTQPARIKIVFKDATAALLPIGVLVVLAVGGSYALPSIGVKGTVANLLAMLTGLLTALIIVLLPSREALKKSLRIFTKPTIWGFVVLVIGVQTFSAVLKRPLGLHEITLVGLMRDEFLRLGIPLIAVMMAIPFISGMVTGVAMGFVGASFPLVFGLLGTDPTTGQVLGLTTLAYGFGYLGMMLSPVHICYVVTCEYFKHPMMKTYKLIALPLAIVAAGVLILSSFYYLVF